MTACVPNDIVALWHMDETSGSVMHDAVGDNDGNLSAVQVPSLATIWASPSTQQAASTPIVGTRHA